MSDLEQQTVRKDSKTGDPLAALDAIRVILIDTSHPGNIGATARAMKVMGLSRLHLVAPHRFPHAEATALASGADDLLASAVVHDSVPEALAGCGLVLGTSARLRSLPLPLTDARGAATRAIAESARHPVALLFGRERYGLTNEDIQRCHCLVQIPANPDYASLNLAQAVQVLCYELRMAALAAAGETLGAIEQPADWQPADGQEMDRFYQHLQSVLTTIGFLNPAQPKRLMARLQRLFNRARPDQNEVNILRGWLSATETAANNTPGDE